MPILLDERVVTIEMADLYTRCPITRPSSPHKRSTGWHQSAILAYIARTCGWLEPGEPLEDDLPLIMAMGMAWEEFAASLYPEMEWQPGEMCRDEIFSSADGITPPDHNPYFDSPCIDVGNGMLMEEFKLTYKATTSGQQFLTDKKWAMWRHQGREYCHVWGARVERWHVCHIRGDYKTFGPVYKQYVLAFTGEECRQTHQMLVNNRDVVEMEIHE